MEPIHAAKPDAPVLADTSYQVLRETWLTRNPRPDAFFVTMLTTLVLVLVSLCLQVGVGISKDLFSASGESVFGRHEYWRLWTTIFAHADLGHLLSNTYLFFILGFFLYGYFGWTVFPAAALLGGAVANWLVIPTYDPKITLIGASGVVYWMGGAWLTLYYLLSRQKNWMHRLVRTLGVAILLFMPAESFEPSISYRTHLAGFAVGTVSGLLQYATHYRTYRAAERYETIVDHIEADPQYGPQNRLVSGNELMIEAIGNES